MPQEPTLEDLFGYHKEAIKADFRKCIPATVTAVHTKDDNKSPMSPTVDCQAGVTDFLHDELGNTIDMDAASWTQVPLGMMRGGGALVYVPVAVGDSVLLIFSDISTDTWRLGNGTPVAPGFVGRHTADSPFAIPMVAPDTTQFVSPDSAATDIIIGFDRGASQIRVSPSGIALGNPAGDAVALASKVDNIMTLLKTLATSITSAMGYLAAASTPAGPMTSSGSDSGAYTALGTAADNLSQAIASVKSTLVSCG